MDVDSSFRLQQIIQLDQLLLHLQPVETQQNQEVQRLFIAQQLRILQVLLQQEQLRSELVETQQQRLIQLQLIIQQQRLIHLKALVLHLILRPLTILLLRLIHREELEKAETREHLEVQARYLIQQPLII